MGLSDRKHSLIQVSGEWVKESSTSVYVHLHAGVVAASDNMLTHQQACIQVTSSHMRENVICSLHAEVCGLMQVVMQQLNEVGWYSKCNFTYNSEIVIC